MPDQNGFDKADFLPPVEGDNPRRRRPERAGHRPQRPSRHDPHSAAPSAATANC